MTVDEYVAERRHLDKVIQCKLEEIAELEALAMKVSPSSGHGDTGKVSDKVGKTVAKIVDLEAEINAHIDRLVDMKSDLMKKIDALSDPMRRVILERKYILNNTIEVIAEKTGYSVPQINRILPAAKKELEKMIENDMK